MASVVAQRLPPLLCLAAVVAGGNEASAQTAGSGAALFEQYCIPCHGPDGRARTPVARKLGVKDLTESRLPDAEIIHQITEGRKDTHGKDRMPAFKDKLKPAEIEAVAAFVKALRK